MFASLKEILDHHKPAPLSPDDLLKLATKAHDAGDLSRAVDLLRQAYAEIARGFVSY